MVWWFAETKRHRIQTQRITRVHTKTHDFADHVPVHPVWRVPRNVGKAFSVIVSRPLELVAVFEMAIHSSPSRSSQVQRHRATEKRQRNDRTLVARACQRRWGSRTHKHNLPTAWLHSFERSMSRNLHLTYICQLIRLGKSARRHCTCERIRYQ